MNTSAQACPCPCHLEEPSQSCSPPRPSTPITAGPLPQHPSQPPTDASSPTLSLRVVPSTGDLKPRLTSCPFFLIPHHGQIFEVLFLNMQPHNAGSLALL